MIMKIKIIVKTGSVGNWSIFLSVIIFISEYDRADVG